MNSRNAQKSEMKNFFFYCSEQYACMKAAFVLCMETVVSGKDEGSSRQGLQRAAACWWGSSAAQ